MNSRQITTSRALNRFPRWAKSGGKWTKAVQPGKTARQLILKETEFYLDNCINSSGSKIAVLCKSLAAKFDNRTFMVSCSCGHRATCYEITSNAPTPTFLCNACGQQANLAVGYSGTICNRYADLFVAFPGTDPKDRVLRNETLKYVREAKGFRKYVTARKAKRFIP